MKREIITKLDPKSVGSETFRTLRTNLQYMQKDEDECQTFVVTSTVQGEGKSFVTANTVVTFAQAGKRTLLIDADMRRPRQHDIFKVDMYPGLSNYLAGISTTRSKHEITLEECIYKTKVDNLYIMPAGNIPPNPSELLQSHKLNAMLSVLKPNFDVIIFDGAPCLLVTDSTIIARNVDYAILVCSQNKTKLDDLKEAVHRIHHVGGHIAGVVLNRVKVSKSEYGERYYYRNEDLEAESNAKIFGTSSRTRERERTREKEKDKTEKILENDDSKTTKNKKSRKTNENDIDLDNISDKKVKDILEQISKIEENDKD